MDINNLLFSNHLIERIKERNLKTEWILSAIKLPDEQINVADNEVYFYKIIVEYREKWLKVVVNPLNSIIVTAYFDRNKKGKTI